MATTSSHVYRVRFRAMLRADDDTRFCTHWAPPALLIFKLLARKKAKYGKKRYKVIKLYLHRLALPLKC